MFFLLQSQLQTSVTVTNSSVNVGSTLTLICTVELSPVIDVPVTVNTEWTGPDGFITTTLHSVWEALHLHQYSHSQLIGRYQSGDYTCTATVRPNLTSTYLTGSGVLSNTTSIVACKFQFLMFFV